MRAKCTATARLCKLALTHRRRSRSWRRQSPRQSRRRPRRRRQRTRRRRRRQQLRKRAERRVQTTRGGRAPGDARARLARQQTCTHLGGQPRWQRRRRRRAQTRRASRRGPARPERACAGSIAHGAFAQNRNMYCARTLTASLQVADAIMPKPPPARAPTRGNAGPHRRKTLGNRRDIARGQAAVEFGLDHPHDVGATAPWVHPPRRVVTYVRQPLLLERGQRRRRQGGEEQEYLPTACRRASRWACARSRRRASFSASGRWALPASTATRTALTSPSLFWCCKKGGSLGWLQGKQGYSTGLRAQQRAAARVIERSGVLFQNRGLGFSAGAA